MSNLKEKLSTVDNLDISTSNLGMNKDGEFIVNATLVRFRKAEFSIPDSFKGNLSNIPTNEVAKRVSVLGVGKSLIDAQNDALTKGVELLGL